MSAWPRGRILRFRKQPNCALPRERNHKKLNATLFVPSHQWPKSLAYLCYKETTTVCTHTSFFGAKGLVEPGSVSRRSASFEECHKASATNMFEGVKLVKDRALPKLWTTNKTVDVKYKWWSTECSSKENFIMEVGEVRSHDGKEVVSNLLPLDTCELQLGFCKVQDAIVIWSLRSILKFCPYVRRGVFLVTKNGNYVSVPSLQVSFELTSKRGHSIHSCVPERAFLSKQGVLVYIGIHHGHRKTELQDTIQAEHERTELEKLRFVLNLTEDVDPINAKLNFLMQSFVSLLTDFMNNEHRQFCLLYQRELEIAKQLIQLDPTKGIRALMGRDDLSAEFRGEELYVHECHSLPVEKFYKDYKHPVTNKCHLLMPVKVQGHVWFLNPGSRDIVPAAPEIKCSSAPIDSVPPNKKSYVVPKNSLLEPFHSQKKLTFSSPPLFHSRVVLPSETSIAFSSRIMFMEKSLHASINFTSHISLNPNVVRETLIGFGEMAGMVITHTGSALGGIFHEALDGVSNLAANIISPFISLAETVAVAGIIILLIGLIFWKIYSQHQFKQRVKMAKQAFMSVVKDDVDD